MSDTNKHFKFDLDRKLNPWLRFEPNFLTNWLHARRQIEKTTVYLLFSLFIQYSAKEVRWVFSRTKITISWLQWLENKWDALLWAIAIFQLTELNIKANLSCFYVHMHELVLNDAMNYAQKCPMQMWGITLKDKKWNIKYKEVAVVGALPNMQTFFTPPQSDRNCDVPWMFRILI